MRLVRVFPDHRVIDLHDSDVDGWREAMAGLYRPSDGPFVRLNLIASVDGAATGIDGTSNSLSSRVDRALMRSIRELSDVVLVGAASVRAEGYRMPQTARLAIVTSSGDLRGHRMGSSPAGHALLVLCPESAAERVRESTSGVEVEIVTLPDRHERISMVDVIGALSLRSLVRVLCEGGPSLASQVVQAGVVDELCLTTAPTLRANGVRLLGPMAGAHPVSLRQVLVDDDGFLFARWSLSDRGRATP